jgi:hypothetical protein
MATLFYFFRSFVRIQYFSFYVLHNITYMRNELLQLRLAVSGRRGGMLSPGYVVERRVASIIS